MLLLICKSIASVHSVSNTCSAQLPAAANVNKTKSPSIRKQMLYQENYKKGVDKFTQQLDWVQIIRSLQELKVVASMMLSEKQKAITKFNKEMLISPTAENLSMDKLMNSVQEEMLNQRLKRVPKENDDELVIKCYKEATEDFMEEYMKGEITKQDISLFKSIT